MKQNRGLIGLALMALVYLGAVIAILSHLSKSVDSPRPRLQPLPTSACGSPLLGVSSTLAYVRNAEYSSEIVTATRQRLGAQVVRDSLLWDQIEPTKGARNWTRLDAVLKRLRSAGIEPLLDVVGSPTWANGVPRSKANHNLYVPRRGVAFDEWLRRYADFVGAAANRYRGAVRRWEIWNEPNAPAFWRPRPDPAAYRRLYETLRMAILREDPKAQVAVGGLSHLGDRSGPHIDGLTFLRQLTQGHPRLGAVAIHPYAGSDQAPTVHLANQNNFDDIGAVRRRLVAAGYSVPLWVTEWGWPTKTIGERRQARYVNQSLRLLERRYRYVQVATYFADRDLPPRFTHGLLDENLRPKPAAAVFRAHAARLRARCERR